ncbi:MAG: nucleotidyltransferase domain-containing protein [Candidatus Vogelbacteria bacterium]|nr:nucleotidyltransferase domain-containing protein [Candidatus Vogelbacteria bacterium]
MDEADKNKKIAEIAKRHRLTLLVLFGSQATGHTHKKSDVDVGYLANREIDYRENYDISIELAKIFKNPEVELVNLENVSPALKKQVADQGIVLFEAEKGKFDFFSIHAHRAYIETKPLRLYQRQSINDFIKEYAR